MLAPMELLLIVLFLIGVGALVSSVAARRAAERPAPRPAPSPTQATEGSEAAVFAAEPDAADLAEPEITPLSEIQDQPPEERRKYPRIQSDQTFTLTPFAGRAMLAQASDVSVGGMRFGLVGCTLRPGDLVRVTFNIGAETVAAIGSVLRVRELDPITCEVSLEFVRLDPWAAQLLEQALQAEA